MKRAILCTVSILILLAACGGGNDNPVVTIQTEFGDIDVELYADRAPATVENFLKYVDGGLFENGRFYRVVDDDNQPNNDVRINVIQGGRSRGGREGFPPVGIETTDSTGVLHLDGTISMARSGPSSATSEFFICVGDQPSLDYGGARNPDGWGFAAFGKVIRGMDVVETIYEQPHEGQRYAPVIPIENIVRQR